MRWLFGAIALFGLWLLMSGVYKPLIVGLGAVSAVVATFVVYRMEQASAGAVLRVRQRPLATFAYFFWLLKEIAKSNWAVTLAIMSPQMPIRQHFFKVPFTQKTEMGQTIYGNSITLTPGTITVEVEDNQFWVHAICYEDGTPDDLAEMDRRVTRTEAA